MKVPATRKRITTREGQLLHQETTRIEFEGDQPIQVVDIIVDLCPSCGSRLHQAQIVGVCDECGEPVCSNCASRCECKRTLCSKHKRLGVLGHERLIVCRECGPIIANKHHHLLLLELEQIAGKAFEREEELKLKREQIHMREAQAAHERALSLRKQDHVENEARFNAQIACEKLRLDMLRTVAPTAYRFLQLGATSSQLKGGR